MYMLYVVTVFDLFMRMKWELVKMVWAMLAGCIPFVSFVVERRITAKVREALAA
jgi:integral membrane protein